VFHRGSEACFEDIAEITPATSKAASFSPSNLASKVVTLGKLEGAAAVLPQTSPTCSSSNPQRGEVAGGLQYTLRLKSEGVGERLKPAVLQFDLLASRADLTGLSPVNGDFYTRAFSGLVTLRVVEHDYGGN
jgi:hypothetical protein